METTTGNGAPEREPPSSTVGQRMGQLGDSAQHFFSEARGAVTDLVEAIDLRGRVQRHPYAMLAAAAGVGYVLGGGLFTPFTARLLRLGIRLAALPMVKDELMNMAESAVDAFVAGAQRRPPGDGQRGV